MTSEKQISPTRLAFKLQIQILSGPNKAAKMKKNNHRCKDIEVTSWLVSADDFSSRVARGANERVSAANE